MAISLIQYAPAIANGSSSSARTISLTGVAAGNCLVLGVSGYSSQVSTVVDTTTGHGSLAFTQGLRYLNSAPWIEIWYQLSAYGGDTTVTVTPSAGAYLTLFLAEFSGVATSSQPRATATGGSLSTVTTVSTGSFSAGPTSGDLIVSLLNVGTNAGTGPTWDNGESTIGSQLNAGSNEGGAMGWVLSNGTNTVRKATWGTNVNSPCIAAIALKAAAASGGPTSWLFNGGFGQGFGGIVTPWGGGF